MDIFGIGPLELVFILLLALIILGPKDLRETGKTIGRSLNKIVRSDTWRTIAQTSKELRLLPNKLMREANLDEWRDSLDPLKSNPRTRPEGGRQFPEWAAPSRPEQPDAAAEPVEENSIATQDDPLSSE